MSVDNSGLLASALSKTDLELYKAVDGQNSWRQGIKARGERIAKYRRYERGEHDSSLTPQMRAMLRLSTSGQSYDFNVNYSRIVIDKMASRLRVSEIVSSDKLTNDYTNSILQLNDFDSMQGTWYRAAIRDGDSFVMIDPATLRWTSEPAYDGFSGIVAIFSPMQDYPLWACKLWSESDTNDLAGADAVSTVRMKLKVYQKDRITSWVGGINTAEVSPDLVDPEIAWPLDKIDLIHFANLVDNYTQYGESEVRVVIPPQDIMNRTLHSMVMASEFSAFKIAWSIGMEINKEGITPGAVINLVLQDAAGKNISEMTPDQVAFLSAVRVGEFDSSDISQYTGQLDAITKHMSQVSQTPIYGVTSEGNLSGDALKQLETGLIGKVNRFQRENGSAVKKLIELTAEIQNEFNTGKGTAPEIKELSINWASAEIIDTSTAITSILDIAIKRPNLFTDDFLRTRIGALLGLTQKQIADEGDVVTQQERLTEAQARVQAVNAGIPLITLLKREGWSEEEITAMLEDKQTMMNASGTSGQALLNTLRVRDQTTTPASNMPLNQGM